MKLTDPIKCELWIAHALSALSTSDSAVFISWFLDSAEYSAHVTILADRMNLSIRQVRRALKSLEEKGFLIRAESTPENATRYVLPPKPPGMSPKKFNLERRRKAKSSTRNIEKMFLQAVDLASKRDLSTFDLQNFGAEIATLVAQNKNTQAQIIDFFIKRGNSLYRTKAVEFKRVAFYKFINSVQLRSAISVNVNWNAPWKLMAKLVIPHHVRNHIVPDRDGFALVDRLEGGVIQRYKTLVEVDCLTPIEKLLPEDLQIGVAKY